jgi:hypothetical protein
VPHVYRCWVWGNGYQYPCLNPPHIIFFRDEFFSICFTTSSTWEPGSRKWWRSSSEPWGVAKQQGVLRTIYSLRKFHSSNGPWHFPTSPHSHAFASITAHHLRQNHW